MGVLNSPPTAALLPSPMWPIESHFSRGDHDEMLWLSGGTSGRKILGQFEPGLPETGVDFDRKQRGSDPTGLILASNFPYDRGHKSRFFRTEIKNAHPYHLQEERLGKADLVVRGLEVTVSLWVGGIFCGPMNSAPRVLSERGLTSRAPSRLAATESVLIRSMRRIWSDTRSAPLWQRSERANKNVE